MSTRQQRAPGTAPAANGPALIGRYEPPDVRTGDRVYCRYRKAWCRVTGWGTGPIRWPRVQQIGVRGRPGLLVNATLERAVRTESAVALGHWLGLSAKPVSWWRRAFGASGRAGTPGSRAVHRSAPPPARVMAGVDRNTRSAVARWTAAELARLGTDTDGAVAAAIGRSPSAVTRQRVRRALPPFDPAARPWTPDEVALLGTDRDDTIAARIGRTPVAVTSKRLALRVPARAGSGSAVRPDTRPLTNPVSGELT